MWLTEEQFGTAAERLFCLAPVRSLHLEQCAGLLPRLLQAPRLQVLTALDLRANGLGDAEARALASAPFLMNLTELNVCLNDLSDEGVEAVAASTHLRNLTVLNVSFNRRLGNGGARAWPARGT